MQMSPENGESCKTVLLIIPSGGVFYPEAKKILRFGGHLHEKRAHNCPPGGELCRSGLYASTFNVELCSMQLYSSTFNVELF